VFAVNVVVKSLPEEYRRLLLWRMSPITPNVVKSCLARSGFKPTTSTRRSFLLHYHISKIIVLEMLKTLLAISSEHMLPVTFPLPRRLCDQVCSSVFCLCVSVRRITQKVMGDFDIFFLDGQILRQERHNSFLAWSGSYSTFGCGLIRIEGICIVSDGILLCCVAFGTLSE